MKFFILSLALLMISPLLAESLPIIPMPVSVKQANGSYALTGELAIRYQTELKNEAELLAQGIEKATGIKPKLVDARLRIALQRPITLSTTKESDTHEAYHLKVTPTKINIVGSDAAGVHYATQSLLQLIPLKGGKSIPSCTIQDSPRFPWRGMHLDVSRHMFAVADIKKWIDWLAFHKFNTFHWHLTDDQGWRIEIKKFPKLTQIGAYRESTPPYLDRWGADGKRYGGFYSQKEIKEIVAYAKQRHIKVIPEIDMPGHMSAALAAYPELGNDDLEGYKPSVKTVWGIHPDTLAPKEETFQWIDDVLSEICAIFPSEYIHIGGDEVYKDQWKKSKFAQSVMQREGLKNAQELQSYFIRRISDILHKKGRKLIGWDEIREGGLPAGATVMNWRGWTHAVESIEEGHNVIMAPGSHTYFDHYQFDPAVELSKGSSFEAIGGFRPLQSVYNFNPVPPRFHGTEEAKLVLGCQGQLWTEYMKTWDKVEYMAFPRIAALSEVAWSPQESRDYKDFLVRLKPTLARYAHAGVRYFDPFNPGKLETRNGASVETSLAYDRGLPEYAVIGSKRFGFFSSSVPTKEDHFTIHLEKATKGTITIETGGAGKKANYKLAAGMLEVSSDGKTWTQIATFKKGTATGEAPAHTKHIRIRFSGDQKQRLHIEEVHFQ